MNKEFMPFGPYHGYTIDAHRDIIDNAVIPVCFNEIKKAHLCVVNNDFEPKDYGVIRQALEVIRVVNVDSALYHLTPWPLHLNESYYFDMTHHTMNSQFLNQISDFASATKKRVYLRFHVALDLMRIGRGLLTRQNLRVVQTKDTPFVQLLSDMTNGDEIEIGR